MCEQRQSPCTQREYSSSLILPCVEAVVRSAHLRRRVVALAVAAAVRVASIRGAVAAVGFAPTRRLGYAKAPVLAVVGIRPAENGCVYSPTRAVSGCGAAIGLAVPRVACCRRTEKWKRAFIREVRFSFRGNGLGIRRSFQACHSTHSASQK